MIIRVMPLFLMSHVKEVPAELTDRDFFMNKLRLLQIHYKRFGIRSCNDINGKLLHVASASFFGVS